jgi:hypothetical protein
MGEEERTYGFVEEEKGWVFQYETGDGETLFLSSWEYLSVKHPTRFTQRQYLRSSSLVPRPWSGTHPETAGWYHEYARVSRPR